MKKLIVFICSIAVLACLPEANRLNASQPEGVAQQFSLAKSSHDAYNMCPDSVVITYKKNYERKSGDYIIRKNQDSHLVIHHFISDSIYKLPLYRSIDILETVRDVFKKPKGIIVKKKYTDLKCEGKFPWIKFVIYRNGKSKSYEYYITDWKDHYKITYSEDFLKLCFSIAYEVDGCYEEI